MNTGDIVRHEGKLWKVSSRNRDYGTFVLVDHKTNRVEIPADLDLDVIASTKEWPFVAIPTKAFKYGRIVDVVHNGHHLMPMVDWCPSDMLRAGGSLFFSPDLGLKRGDVLVAVHEKGSNTRITITKSFGNVKQRQQRKASPWKPPAPVTVYDRLSGRNPFDEDD